MTRDESWEDIARDVFACRDCRGEASDAMRAFAAFVGDAAIPPEAADAPERIEVLFVSANPQGLASTGIPELARYLAPARRTFSNRPAEADRFVRQSLKIMPTGQSWWASEGTPIGNTRACRCPSTSGWSRAFDWAARHCTEKFLARELRCLQPKVVVVMGAMAREIVGAALGLAPKQDPEVSQCRFESWEGIVIVMRHPSQGASDQYLAGVRVILEAALRGEIVAVESGTDRTFAPPGTTQMARTSSSRDWHDLPANASLHSPVGRREEDARPGTTIHVALQLTSRAGGATLQEIQQGLDSIGLSHHDALRLLRWMSKHRGWGFVRDTAERIHLVRS